MNRQLREILVYQELSLKVAALILYTWLCETPHLQSRISQYHEWKLSSLVDRMGLFDVTASQKMSVKKL